MENMWCDSRKKHMQDMQLDTSTDKTKKHKKREREKIMYTVCDFVSQLLSFFFCMMMNGSLLFIHAIYTSTHLHTHLRFSPASSSSVEDVDSCILQCPQVHWSYSWSFFFKSIYSSLTVHLFLPVTLLSVWIVFESFLWFLILISCKWKCLFPSTAAQFCW